MASKSQGAMRPETSVRSCRGRRGPRLMVQPMRSNVTRNLVALHVGLMLCNEAVSCTSNTDEVELVLLMLDVLVLWLSWCV